MNKSQKKLFIIGASVLQLPAIKKAKEMGMYVAVADFNPEAVGIKYADEYFNVSTIDEKGICEAARKFGADGIMTLATDMPMRSVAYACKKLGLKGISYDTAVKATDKGEMIKSFSENGVACPWYFIAENEKQLESMKCKITYPCITKPTDNSGSRGVMLVHNEEELKEAFSYSSENGRSGSVIIEEYMTGSEVSVEIIVLDGTVNVLQITDKLTTGAPHFVEMGHSQPSQLGEENIKKIKDLACRAVKAVGITDGPAHVEIMLTKDGPKMVELGARMGGDCITTHLVPLSTGIDMIKATIEISCGKTPDVSPKFEKGSAIRYFCSPSGVIKNIAGVEKALNIEGVKEISMVKNIGDTVGNIGSSTDRVGFVIAQADTENEAVMLCEKALKTVEISVEEGRIMKVLRLSSYCYPEQIASSHLAKDMNDAYEKAGVFCEIHTPTPTRGIDEETRKKYRKIKYEELNNGFVQIHRFAMFKEPKNSLFRAFRYTLCIIRQFFNGLFAKDIDVYYASSTPPINGLMFPILKLFRRYNIVYNLQDIFPDSLVNTGMTKKGSVLWWIGRVVEIITYKFADKIIVISEDFKKNILEKGVPEEKIEVVYNWVDENQVVNVDRKDNILFDKYNLDRDKFYICYSGNIGYSQNMDMLCRVAKKLEANSNIQIVIIGEGAYKEKLQTIISEQNIKNITLLPFQDYSDISHVFSLGDAGLIISKKGVGTNSVPSKTWSIMSAERPVLASFDKGSELDSIVTEKNCGICVDADDENALYDAIINMYENKDTISLMGKRGREFILENLTKEKATGKIIEIIKGAAGK